MMPALNIKLQIGISGWIATWAWYATCGSEGPCLRPQRKTAGTCWRISRLCPVFNLWGGPRAKLVGQTRRSTRRTVTAIFCWREQRSPSLCQSWPYPACVPSTADAASTRYP